MKFRKAQRTSFTEGWKCGRPIFDRSESLTPLRHPSLREERFSPPPDRRGVTLSLGPTSEPTQKQIPSESLSQYSIRDVNIDVPADDLGACIGDKIDARELFRARDANACTYGQKGRIGGYDAAVRPHARARDPTEVKRGSFHTIWAIGPRDRLAIQGGPQSEYRHCKKK